MIVPMKRMQLAALKRDEDAIMKVLQKIEAVHIIPAEDVAQPKQDVALFDEKIKRISGAHSIIKLYGKKRGMSAPPEYTEDELDTALKESEELLVEIEELNRELSTIKIKSDKHRSKIEHLMPFFDMPVPIERISSTPHVTVKAGITDTAGRVVLENRSAEMGFSCEFYGSGANTAVLLAFFKEDTESAEILKTINYQEFRFPAECGTVKQIVDREKKEAHEEEKRTDEIKNRLEILSQKQKNLEMAYDAAVIDRDREAGKTELLSTQYAFVLDAWIKETDQDAVIKAVESVTDAYDIELRDPSEDETPPTALKNGKLATPFESLTDMYSRPAYKGIDGTAFFTPFYLLFFGMMLADSGYGLALFLGGLLYQKLLKPRNNTLKLVQVITWCGLSTVIMGLVLGTFFGLDWADVFGAGTIFPLIDPLENIMTMIIVCCALGLFQMMFGICIKIYMCFKEKDYMAGVFDNLSWIFLVLGLVGLLASGYVESSWLPLTSKISTILGAAMILLFAGRTKKNIIKRVGSGLGALYNVTSYLGDTLSYVRILALGLVGGAMGMVFNMIGDMIYSGLASSGILGAIIGVLLSAVLLIVLHAFSLFINTLGTYVHCARLQYVEFFGKFYEANGVMFAPLGYNSKYVKVKKN